MATTTATLTISSADLTSNPLAITTSSTLYKAGTTIGLEQTTGLSKKVYAAAQSNATLISAGDYADNTHSRLYGGDFLFIPYEGEQDIDITSSTTNMELEFMVINEG